MIFCLRNTISSPDRTVKCSSVLKRLNNSLSLRAEYDFRMMQSGQRYLLYAVFLPDSLQAHRTLYL